MSVESAHGRDFNNYHAGDNVFHLADSLIPELAERVGIALSDDPTVTELGKLVCVLGPNKVLRDNPITSALTINEAADFVDRSGILKPFYGPVRGKSFTDDGISTDTTSTAKIVLGVGVANWSDRATKLLVAIQRENVLLGAHPQDAFGQQRVAVGRDGMHIVAGERVMDSKTEIINPNIVQYIKRYDRTPTEGEYASEFVVPRLKSVDIHNAQLHRYRSTDGSEIARGLVHEHPEILIGEDIFTLPDGTTYSQPRKVTVVATATAGLQFALQLRAAATGDDSRYDRRQGYVERTSMRPLDNGSFDGRFAELTQLHLMTDGFQVARTDEDMNNPKVRQSPFTALRQVALSAKLLREAYGTTN